MDGEEEEGGVLLQINLNRSTIRRKAPVEDIIIMIQHPHHHIPPSAYITYHPASPYISIPIITIHPSSCIINTRQDQHPHHPAAKPVPMSSTFAAQGGSAAEVYRGARYRKRANAVHV